MSRSGFASFDIKRRLLLSHGAALSDNGPNQETPLHLLCRRCLADRTRSNRLYVLATQAKLGMQSVQNLRPLQSSHKKHTRSSWKIEQPATKRGNNPPPLYTFPLHSSPRHRSSPALVPTITVFLHFSHGIALDSRKHVNKKTRAQKPSHM